MRPKRVEKSSLVGVRGLVDVAEVMGDAARRRRWNPGLRSSLEVRPCGLALVVLAVRGRSR